MKKIVALLLSAILLLSLAACQGETPETTPNLTSPSTTAPGETDPVVNTDEAFRFTLSGVELVPCADFDPTVLPEADSVYEVPSCAIEGTDNVYNYGTVEITAYDDGTGEVIYSIYILDANTSTDEGLYLGDDLAMVESIYGTDYTRDGSQITYRKGSTLLVLLMEDEFVSSIELRMDTE